ncbi:MAG: SpvB/TcaC N-terminal domain-containing protein [Paludibacteraceae bacterium]
MRIIILFNKNVKSDVEYTFVPSFNKTYKTFERGKTDTLTIANATLNVSDSSLLSDKKLSVMNLRDVDVPAMDYGMINVTGVSNGLRFLPHGEHFKEGTTVAIKYDRTKIPSGYTENDVKTYYFDNDTKHWVALDRDSVDKQLCMVVSKTTHFTDMINGVIKTPESPETQGFTPTMMNDIKAADPASGIQLISPPTANNNGSANLSYKIEVPPARNGMNPDLTIQYNSDGGSGWLGEGWDLNIPSITVDTRWGVPQYDIDRETETYLLNGVPLARAFVSGSINDSIDEKMFFQDRGIVYLRNKENAGGNQYQFYTKTLTDFPLIIRYGTDPDNYYWIVSDKKGTKYYYGYGIDNKLANYVQCIKSGDKQSYNINAIAEWKLQSIVDIHGDSIAYTYNICDETGYTAGLSPKAIYLSKIEGFTCNTDKSYSKHTEINFTSNSNKTKKTNNARYGFLASSQKLLDEIKIRYSDKGINSSFDQDASSLKNTVLNIGRLHY